MGKKTEGEDATIVGTEIQQLPVKLTPEELLEKGQQLAHVEEKMLEHEQTADAMKKNLKAKETALIAERSNLANIVRSKHELRDVRVSIVHDYGKTNVDRYRDDTGVKIESRPMNDNERQRILPGTASVDGEAKHVVPKLRRAPEPVDDEEDENEGDDGED